ncbi:MAG TPA: DUF2231 domain-containing protein [Bacillota bacterium]|nr:DUF2231 domain-containing protein [Bacillota bacterium]
MRTPTSLKGHPLHPILVALPIGLFVFSLIADIIYLARWGGAHWQSVAYFNLAGGIICALVAAVPGFIDLFAVSDPTLKRTGIVHMCIMLLTVAIFAVDFWMRHSQRFPYITPFILSIIGILVLLVGGWLGAKLVHVFGMTVEERMARRSTGGPTPAV